MDSFIFYMFSYLLVCPLIFTPMPSTAIKCKVPQEFFDIWKMKAHNWFCVSSHPTIKVTFRCQQVEEFLSESSSGRVLINVAI